MSLTLLFLLASSCAYTAQAVAELPEGYWNATWHLIDAVLSDLANLVSMIL